VRNMTSVNKMSRGNIMKGMIVSVFSLLAMVPAAFALDSKPVEVQTTISFSAPFPCDDTHGRETLCLADEFETGRKVVLINETEICKANTSGTFTNEYPSGESGTATHLEGAEKCFSEKADMRQRRRFLVAVVGAEPEAVHLISPNNDESHVSKEIELKARKLAAPNIENPQRLIDLTRVPIGLSDAQPKEIRTGNVTLLIFDLQADGKPWEPGPTVLLSNNKVFRLSGSCTYKPFFFSVNDKLYLAYSATVVCCGCGDAHYFVYDISNGSPALVYHNGKFSN
jgi:hypothetical protein